ALLSQHSDASTRPSYALRGTQWVKNVSGSVDEVYYYDGTHDIKLFSIDITNGRRSVLALAGLSILDTDASHSLAIGVGTNLSANRNLTISTGDSNRALDISAADVTVSAFGASLTDDADAATARTTLGLATVASSGSASDLGSGTLPAGRLPALSGDISTSA